MLSLKVGGQWLKTIGAHGPVTVEYGVHGLDSVSWPMRQGLTHPVLRGMSPIRVYDGGILIGDALMQEPGGDGDYAGRGLWRMCESALSMNAAGALTTVPDDAIIGALSRGEITFGTRSGITSTPWASTAQPSMTLAQLLEGWANQAGLRWRVPNADVGVEVGADPTVPQWHVPHAAFGRSLTPAEDEFYTHLVGWYLTSTNVFATATVGSAEAASVFGRRTGTVDLTPKGVIFPAEATSVLTGMFLLSGARMGWGEGLELGYGQITTPGGTPAPLTQVRAGQMIRLSGTVDTSRANRMLAYTDLVIGTSKHTEGSDTITLTPVGYADRTFSDILSVAVEEDD